MRIRKHAKISPLLYATSSLKAGALVQTHVCQLNQSPWDVMTFSPPSSPPPPPPPPCQANGSGVRAGNGSSERCVSAGEREFTHKVEPDEEAAPPPPLVKNERSTTIICCKTDGKSWQCRREAAKGNSLCEHHLSLVKSYSSGAGTHHAAKKSAAAVAVAEAPRRSRQKKAPASGSSNPYEFYYYSGFGPRWGKRRGEGRKNNSSMTPKNAGDDEASVEEEEAAAAVAISNIDEFDYEEYEDDDEDESRDNGRKRVRKPIKARSLKSLL